MPGTRKPRTPQRSTSKGVESKPGEKKQTSRRQAEVFMQNIPMDPDNSPVLAMNSNDEALSLRAWALLRHFEFIADGQDDDVLFLEGGAPCMFVEGHVADMSIRAVGMGPDKEQRKRALTIALAMTCAVKFGPIEAKWGLKKLVDQASKVLNANPAANSQADSPTNAVAATESCPARVAGNALAAAEPRPARVSENSSQSADQGSRRSPRLLENEAQRRSLPPISATDLRADLHAFSKRKASPHTAASKGKRVRQSNDGNQATMQADARVSALAGTDSGGHADALPVGSVISGNSLANTHANSPVSAQKDVRSLSWEEVCEDFSSIAAESESQKQQGEKTPAKGTRRKAEVKAPPAPKRTRVTAAAAAEAKTRPAGAAKQASHAVEQTCRRSPRLRAVPARQRLQTKTMPRCDATPGFQKFGTTMTSFIGEAVEVRTLELKGRCLFSTGDHKPKEVICTETPLLRCTPPPRDSTLKAIQEITRSTSLKAELLYAAVRILRHETDLLSKLSVPSAPEPTAATRNALEDVLRVFEGQCDKTRTVELGKLYNALSFHAFSMSTTRVDYVAFEVLSKLGHSCDPNCKVTFKSCGRGCLGALSHIVTGEELRISFLADEDLQLETRFRRQLLLAQWGFHCNCKRCTDVSAPPESSHFNNNFLALASS